jgi:hypothetical protein
MVTIDRTIASGDRLSLGVRAMGQTIKADIAVEDDCVIVEASVPFFLAPFAAKAKLFTESFGTKLLGRPSESNSPSSRP